MNRPRPQPASDHRRKPAAGSERSLRRASRGHHTIVIGASAGGIEPLKRIVSDLPPDLPAAVFVVVHIGQVSYLPEILDRAGALKASVAKNGATAQTGNIYVAPPGFHLLLHGDHMMLRRGPRENLARPAIDPLFRSAALSHGASVVGVLLSGALSDGTAGLRAIKAVGGLAVVQHPKDALVPAMVENALHYAEIDHCLPAAELGGLLGQLASEPAGETFAAPPGVRLEAAIAAQEHSTMKDEDRLGELSVFTCPECHGPLWEIEDGDMLRYRCHTGHAFTADAVMEAQAIEADEILWSLLRAHQQRAAFARRMAERERTRDRSALAREFGQRAREYEADAAVIERILESRRVQVPDDGAVGEEGNGNEATD
ncbi:MULTISPECIES: chemotaxis protein CheB [unclassified Mesorhizobium]|uniref:chemotaxis protein CheB n=1 Tax=unclassified Mesorhizobium TaxID=325217 RepID=UPI000BAF4CBE|nr:MULTISPECIES: chemotaxis protein CheB [unclassified Mesorhizobium]TGT58879.1 chemotaxis protein CheB [Mesorhizobium sp. M00.F.Ca.ET.170.01.1.1]AZO12068.1 chemotaxis protein CheB [Mesorhizobium sp. M3A.F.Ca.ET.080.04.2.1]PBB84432.1 protein-glutamate methylesterase [Mesorhizobium sp. WSM3876]RWB74786.1 MAG: chemotaxis protein CheB [Mesorhizobium sp.]RWB89756.1 MAG: chemotaxis protein CheB [Mesorhizobium sp.]